MAGVVSALLPWEHVVWSIGKATDNILSSDSYYRRFQNSKDGTLVFKSERAYDNILVHTAKRIGFQLAEHYVNIIRDFTALEVNNALRWFGHQNVRRALRTLESESKARQEELKLAREEQKKIRDRQSDNWKEIIQAGESVDDGLGFIRTKEGDTIEAVNPYGERISEALMLYYDSDSKVRVEIKQGNNTKVIETATVCFSDINAQVAQSTSKNIVLTKVQGRDFTRKELVSGGDIAFTISGEVNSNMPGVYPESAVKKLIQICQYNGIVKVNHLLFKQFNVEQIIIQDFKLEHQTFKNVQPYSISCIAVEPDEDVKIEKDTIQLINDVLADTALSGWYKTVLAEKQAQAQSGKSDNERNKALMWISNHI